MFILVWPLIASAPVAAQESDYAGKTLRILVGYTPGGAYDTYTRLISRHLGKHIPGHPTIVVENMPGAGGILVVNHLFNRVKPDGLTLGNWNGAISFQKYLRREGIAFDPPQFEWIAAPTRNTYICMVRRSLAITSPETWSKSGKPVKLGALAPGSDPSDVSRLLAAALELPVQTVDGYKGAADVRLAFNAGEVDGICGSWEGLGPTWQNELKNVNIPVQAVAKANPELPTVPLAIDAAKSDETRQLIRVGLHDRSGLFVSYTFPPKTPARWVRLMRSSFEATLKDPELLKEAGKAQLNINPTSGQELANVVAGLAKLSPPFLTRLKQVLLPE